MKRMFTALMVSSHFYVVGNIDIVILRPYGDYTIQVRRPGDEWKPRTKFSADPMPPAYYRPPTLAEFVQQNNVRVAVFPPHR